MKSMRSALLLAFLLFVGSISAQTVQVNVKDSQGEPVIGASVVEKDTKNGGITDFDGNFTIKNRTSASRCRTTTPSCRRW